MKYKYDVSQECFIREDGLGKKFHINISEARRIMTLYNLGNNVPQIRNKIDFSSNKVYESSVNNFINQVNNGNIDLDGDYPAPSHYVTELTYEERISNLERRMSNLEEKFEVKPKKSLRERLRL